MLSFEDWGLVSFSDAYDRQRTIVSEVQGGGPERLIFCEHPPVITLGRATKPQNVLAPACEIAQHGLEIRTVDRGGDVTLHAPGQLVVYPVVNLASRGRDLHAYMQNLEQMAVDLLNRFDILAVTRPGERGVFVGPRKIISIGVGVRRWVTFHGLGINVTTDLSLFRWIKPCGLDVAMTSLREIRSSITMAAVKAQALDIFEKI